jgi:hypothetical protein
MTNLTAPVSSLNGVRFFADRDPSHKELFDKSSYSFPHTLASHPLFALPRLVQLAESIPNTHYDLGDIQINQRFDQRAAPDISIAEAVDNIDRSGIWMIIRHADKDPEYRELLDRFMEELEELTGISLAHEKKSQEAIVFVASPNRLTPYHIDRECNFLLQIRGRKIINIFDRNDKEVVPDEELERYWTVDNDCAVYKPHLQDRAQVYELVPGYGVHIPVNCPHWLRNGGNVSISLSVSFQFRDSVRANAFRTNYYLRKFGVRPLPPGSSPATDWIKRSEVARAVTRGLTMPAWLLWRYRQSKHNRREQRLATTPPK